MTDETPRPSWEYKEEFGINTKMRAVCEMSIKVAEAELTSLQRKLDKLVYGS